MGHLLWHRRPPRPLRSPILVTAWDGWFDVGGAATAAVEAMRGPHAAHLASIDADEFFDFNEHRPYLRVGPEGHRVVEWPANDVHCRALDNQRRDLVFIEGVEPHLRWRTFVDAVLEVIVRLDVKLVITLGAMIAEIPHTRPPTITGSTTDAKLGKLLGLNPPSYQGPTGIVGAIHQRLDANKIPAVSLRASVPHYVSGAPNPKASRALLERFERVTGLPTRWAELDQETFDWEEQVNEAMTHNDEIIAYVRALEQRYDAQAESSLPTSEDLAAEFERFLRQHDNDPPD